MTGKFKNNIKPIKDKKEIMKKMIDVEFHPIVLEEEVNIDNYTKLSLSQIATVGIGFEPLAAAVQKVINGNKTKSGLYKVTIPKGGQLAEFKNGSGYLGSVLKENGSVGGGQAVLNPLVLNPTMLFMAAALSTIDKKLDSIQEVQEEILGFLVQKEKSEIKGDLNFLADVLGNYKYNWDNDKYKNSNYIKVLDIRQASERKIDFYREQIKSKINKKSFFKTEQVVKRQIEKVQLEFKDYQLALYLYGFSSFLEVMLLENFDSEYLDRISNKIEDYSYKYRELYTEGYNQIEDNAKSSIESQIVSKLVIANRFIGKTMSKNSVISKSQFDEKLIETGYKLGEFGSKRIDNTMKQLVEEQNSYIRPFIENINEVNRLHNKSMELIFDQENIYIDVS